ncbi:dehydrogenase [Agromyces seonyuensis]|uniref:Dehydrogenase n=1 Tax=Agromyces seonyuensis TaxID=2662446 RepID=A0A6I4NWQ3_9MICO|nr:dehydrogenase [Agromyces seonyuensis]MWB98718.1 dehydrogenase [Agromyces seonyuensis]
MTNQTGAPGPAGALTPEHDHTHAAIECPVCFEQLQRNHDWWRARPEGSRLVGLVVAREDMPPILQQRTDLATFGVQILDFKFPAPQALEDWEQRLGRLFSTLQPGDVLVVVNERALGRTPDEAARTIRTLRRYGLVVKVLGHGARHLSDATG